MNIINNWKEKNPFLYNRWPWHLLFWIGYALFRAWPYYITVKYFNDVFLRYMLFSELFFIAATYLTILLYNYLFTQHRYFLYFIAGLVTWIIYLCSRTVFQMNYLEQEPSFKGSNFANIFANNITVVIVYFLFITACKYFKDGYIAQQFEAEKKEQQLLAEVNNLKSQIAPHFLFNTLNNLYGLAVEKSDKLPGLMLQLSDLLRHSLYETQKPFVHINAEIQVLESYIKLESVRLEENLELKLENEIPADARRFISPLILIVFIENAFKHARLVQGEPVEINIHLALNGDMFTMIVKNNYNPGKQHSAHGIGLANVRRRLEVLYPEPLHSLSISQDARYYTTHLQLQLKAHNYGEGAI